MPRSKPFLLAGIAVPFVYFGTIAVAGWMAPGYSHVSRYASELGMKGAPSASLFNGGILLTAIATIAASVGLCLAARAVSGRALWPVLAGLSLGLFGVGLVFGGLFPMPDPRHGGFGLGMAIHASPLLLALALRTSPDYRSLTRFLFAVTILMLLFLAPMMGVGGLVTRANVGLYQRLYALTIFVWVGIASGALLRTASSGSTRNFRNAADGSD